MKRTTSIILSVALILSSLFAFSSVSFAKAEVTNTVTYALLNEVSQSHELHIEGTVTDFQLGSRKMSIPFTLDAKDNTVSLEAKVSFLRLRALYKDGKLSVMLPLFRLYAQVNDFVKFDGSLIENVLSRVWNEAQYFVQDFYLGETSDSESFLGGTYAMEEIVENTANPSFRGRVYYDANRQIKGINVKWQGTVNNLDIAVSSISARADQSKLEFPALYFNITPIVMFIVTKIFA